MVSLSLHNEASTNTIRVRLIGHPMCFPILASYRSPRPLEGGRLWVLPSPPAAENLRPRKVAASETFLTALWPPPRFSHRTVFTGVG